ncbi:hypothetical protein I317_04929 [Kwoniella heveanensis CBS 569]|nr:hypothetical protein I317_04929 [Kwoniella heveanensis CBS 569]
MTIPQPPCGKRLIPFIVLAVFFIVYRTAPTDSLLPSPVSTASLLSWSAQFSQPEQASLPGAARLVPHASDEGVFLETSAFDLPKLIKEKQRGKADARTSYKGLKIAVLEHAGFHEEVVGAVLKTLIDIEANFTLYRDSFRWGYGDILAAGLNYTIDPTPYSDGTYAKAVQNNEIDLTIHISCDHAFWNWPKNKPAYEAMKANQNMEVVCMLHELENLKDDERISWEKAMSQGRLTYLTLSKHVKTFLRSEVLKWADKYREVRWGKVDVEEFVPIFPVDPASLPDSEAVDVSAHFPKSPEKIPSRLAILGNIQTWRRNYNPIIKDLHQALQVDPALWGYEPLLTSVVNATYQPAKDGTRPPVSLHFIGNLAPTSKLEIPDSMRDMVHIHSGLVYTDFYRLLGSMDLVLPAFIGWTYLEKKLSSAIPAGIVSKVPILGSELLLNAYQFLRDPSIVLHQPGMTEIEAIAALRASIDPSNPSSSKALLPVDSRSDAPEWAEDEFPSAQVHLSADSESDTDVRIEGGDVMKRFGGDAQDWEEYHGRLYEANAEMMIDLLERLGSRIRARQARS